MFSSLRSRTEISPTLLEAGSARGSLVDALIEIGRLFPPHKIKSLLIALRSAREPNANLKAQLSEQGGSSVHGQCITALMTAWHDNPAIDGSGLALALETCISAERLRPERLEIVWTGPATEIVPARHTSAVLFELVGLARERLTLASFSAYPIGGLIESLQSAIDRGVRVELVLESTYDSHGKLSQDASAAFAALAQRVFTYVWPRDLRQPGAVMHAKFALADDRLALVTSANLTENGIDKNLELGILIRDGQIPQILTRHVDRLIATASLRRVAAFP